MTSYFGRRTQAQIGFYLFTPFTNTISSEDALSPELIWTNLSVITLPSHNINIVLGHPQIARDQKAT